MNVRQARQRRGEGETVPTSAWDTETTAITGVFLYHSDLAIAIRDSSS
jgi:hypothetical protein